MKGLVAPPRNEERARILCIDDEPAVVEGLHRQLHYHFEVVGATSGADGLARLAGDGGFAVVVCDMRMPEMDGAEVLARARKLCPDVTRVLLTGHADLDAAVAAVNEANVFRFLIKPCSGTELRAALTDAVAIHRSLTAERELLEQTLRGAVAALTDALALANPVAFARATRIQALVRHLIERFEPAEPWKIEVAAMLSQIGTVVLPQETVDKLHRGLPLEESERAAVDELPAIADRLLTSIPRLEDVRRIIAGQRVDFGRSRAGAAPSMVTLGAQMLRVATALDGLEAAGVARHNAVAALSQAVDAYDPELLCCFIEEETGDAEPIDRPRPVRAEEIRVGWTIAEDVHDSDGRLIISRGFLVTESLIERLSNWRGAALQEPIFVLERA